jgi:SWI/SNF-related matrix-associated actin-dependent regulator 1 of chromatin subfamily A
MRIVKDTYNQLFDFQKEGVDFLAKNRSALLADQLGTGKTAQAIHAAQQVGARSILCICPASIKYNWKKEAVKWGYSEKDIGIINSAKDVNKPLKPMTIINYDVIWRKKYLKHLIKPLYDVLILDEVHNVKNPKAKRSKAVWLKNGYCDRAIYRWALTATPVLNRPVELHSMLAKLCPERLGKFRNYIDYTRRYCRGHDGKWGWDALGADNLDELSGRLAGFMLRRTRDCLPGKVLQKIYMPTTKDIEKQLFSGDENASIRRKVGLGKVNACIEHIEGVLEAERKVVVFAYHREVIDNLYKGLIKYNPVRLYGATKQSERQKAIDSFSADSDDCRVFIGQIESAGEGIDGLQNNCSVGIFVEICHTPGIINQAIGRLHRQGQKDRSVFQFILIENTIDEKILNSTIFKEKNIKTIMKDKTIGLEFAGGEEKIKPQNTIRFTGVEEYPSSRHSSIEESLERIAVAIERLV